MSDGPMPMKHIVNVNEVSLLRFMILSIARRDVYVLSVEPLFPPTRRFLQVAVLPTDPVTILS